MTFVPYVLRNEVGAALGRIDARLKADQQGRKVVKDHVMLRHYANGKQLLNDEQTRHALQATTGNSPAVMVVNVTHILRELMGNTRVSAGLTVNERDELIVVVVYDGD